MESAPAPWHWRQNSAAAAGHGQGPGQISPSVEVIVIILTVAFVVSALLHMLIRHLSRRHDSPTAQAPAMAMHMNVAYDTGVAESVMESLPTFAFRAVKGGAGAGVECAICLAEFRGDDTLRLLPACRHAFHVSCVDTWLLSHATCPLCRTPVLAPDCDHGGGGEAGKPGSGEHPADAESAAVRVWLGKLRRSASTGYGGDGAWQADVALRCFSTGHFDYVIDQAPRSVDAGSIRWQQQPRAVKEEEEEDVEGAKLISLNDSHRWSLSEADVASAVSDLNV